MFSLYKTYIKIKNRIGEILRIGEIETEKYYVFLRYKTWNRAMLFNSIRIRDTKTTDKRNKP